MADFDFQPEDFKDSTGLLNKTLAQTQKGLPTGVFASTTASKEPGGGFDNNVLSVSDLLQKIPYARNIGDTADDIYSALLASASGVADLFDGVDKFFLGLLPNDVRRVLDIVGASKGKDNYAFSDEDKANAAVLVAHPNFKVVDGVNADAIKKQVTSGTVSPNIIKFLKLVADQQVDIFIHKLHGEVNHTFLANYHNLTGPNDKKYTKAVDFGFSKNKDRDYSEVDAARIRQIVDSLIDSKRPREVGTGFRLQKTDRETDKHNTLWVRSEKFKKYVHIAIDDWGLPPPPSAILPGNGGGAGSSLLPGKVSQPGMQLWLADRCRQAGLDVIEMPGWQTRGSSSFDPQGVVAHHTAGASSGADLNHAILINGRSDLAGPLCNIGLGRSGKVYIIAAGRANHAGSGGWKGLSGNGSVLGIEAENDGRQAWPQAQLLAYYKLCAALVSGVGRGVDMVCGHKEWTTRKPDPHSLNMNDFRAEVAKYMPGAPGTALPPSAGGGAGPVIGGSVASLAQQVLALTNIVYDANARGTMQGFANGATVMKAGNGTMTGLSSELLNALIQLGRSPGIGTIRISSLITGSHTANSNHYRGRACDIGNEENIKIFQFLYNNRLLLNINELIYSNPPAGTTNLLAGSAHSYGSSTISGHRDHFHFSTRT